MTHLTAYSNILNLFYMEIEHHCGKEFLIKETTQ